MQGTMWGAGNPRRRTGWVVVAASCLLLALSACMDRPEPTAPRAVMTAPSPAGQLGLSSAFDAATFLPLLLDDAGANDVPAQSDMNAMTRADNLTRLAVVWTWDDIDSWGGSGQTGDACALFDTDNPSNGNADFALCVRITNAVNGDVVQLPSGQSPILYGCSDKKTDRCSSPSTGPLPLGNTICEVVNKAANGFTNGDDGFDTLAGCLIDLAAIGNATKANLLNVCSEPSGSPTSNAFDCVVTPGSGFLQIKKKTAPQQSGTTFSFTLNPAANDGTSSFSLTDNTANDETTGLIAAVAGNYSVTETVPTGWALTAASCLRGGSTSTGTKVGNAVNNIGLTIGETTVCTFENNGAPTVTVDKSASPTSILETGGSVTYTVVVTNTSGFAVTLSSLSDDKFGDLNGQGTCATGGSIAASGTYSCTFTKTLAAAAAGSTHTNTVTATVTSAGGQATDTDDATVTYTDVAPTVTVDKSANPTSVPETGGNVTYTVVVTNTASEPITLTGLSDDKFGNLDGQGTCDVPQTIAAAGTYSCTFTKAVSGNAGGSHINTVTATATDDDNNTVTDTDDATVGFTDVLPDISVTKTASPTSVAETGANVTFTVLVTNTNAEQVSLTVLSDDKFGNLSGQGTCAVPQTIAGNGGTFSCTFTKAMSGNAGTSHTNTVTATASDNDGNSDTATDDATVSFTNVAPNISVTKTANPTSLSTVATGALSFSADQTFTTNPPPGGGGAVFASKVCDDKGPNDEPAQVDVNCMDRADNVSGKLFVKWWWDDINSWTGTGQTGDGCALIDTDNDGNVNVAVCARIRNNPSGTQIIQVPSAGAADVYTCGNSKPDRCPQPNGQVSSILTTTCTVAQAPESFPNQGDDGFDVQATCSIDLNMAVFTGTSSRDLINVCLFPSGIPNSNPFDCVVTVGSGFLQIAKVTVPASSQLSGFTLSPAATNGFDAFAVAGGITSGLIPVAPGNHSLTETLISGWQLNAVTCVVDNQSTGTASIGTLSINNFLIKSGQTTLCTFTNTGLITGPVTYTITVTNNSTEAVNLFSLNDNQFGDLTNTTLNPGSTCAVGGTIAGLGTYSCTFTKTLTGAAGTSHTNTVTAVGKDDEGGSDTKTASATVNFVLPP